MKRKFTGKCPECGKEVEGENNWETGEIFIHGHCDNCGYDILEDDTEWRPK